MQNYLKILVATTLVLIRVGEVRAQLDNQTFFSPTPGIGRRDPLSGRPLPAGKYGPNPPDSLAGQLRLSLYAFTFFKDNEYFNKISDGYTLFGTQLNPQLVYYPSPGLRLEAGVFIWKDFGNPALQQVRPTYRGTWTRGANQFIFGNIRPSLNHGYIEPLFDFERVMLKPLEEGLQYRHLSERIFLDVWVDWLRQQYKFSNYQEQIAGGVSSSFRLTKPGSRVQVAIPFQFTAQHHGGQIDTLRRPIQTLFNYATGVGARIPFGTRGQALRLNAYALAFDDHSFTYRLPYTAGAGLYLNGTLETRYVDVMLSYWQGHHFYAPLGGTYYQSLSSSVTDPNSLDPNRHLLLLRLLRDFRISDAAAVTVRVEPVYDFNQRLLDFSFGIYLNFRQDWVLGNIGRRARPGQ